MRKKASRRKRKKQNPAKVPGGTHLSVFGVLNRNGLEIPPVLEPDSADEPIETKNTEFTAWSMPEQRPGFIRARRHDFF